MVAVAVAMRKTRVWEQWIVVVRSVEQDSTQGFVSNLKTTFANFAVGY